MIGHEIDALRDIDPKLVKRDPAAPADEIQNIVFETGKRHMFETLRHWFQTPTMQ